MPWCYLADRTSGNKWIESCNVGEPVNACARDLPVRARFTTNTTWPIAISSKEGVFVRLRMDQYVMPQGSGFTMQARRRAAPTDSPNRHERLPIPQPTVPTDTQLPVPQFVDSVACDAEPLEWLRCSGHGACKTHADGPPPIVECACEVGWAGAICETQLVQYARQNVIDVDADGNRWRQDRAT